MEKDKLLIFDFDGTIADTSEITFKIINDLAPKYNFYKIDPSEIKYFKNLTIHEIVHFLNIDNLKLPFVFFEIRKLLNNYISLCSPVKPEIKQLLIELKSSNKYIIGILTSNSKNNVIKFLNKENIMIFDFIKSAIWFNKQRSLKSIQKKFKTNNTLYIGDEPRDIISSKAVKIKCAAVTWGYSSKKLLSEYNPDFIVSNPKEVLNIIKTL